VTPVCYQLITRGPGLILSLSLVGCCKRRRRAKAIRFAQRGGSRLSAYGPCGQSLGVIQPSFVVVALFVVVAPPGLEHGAGPWAEIEECLVQQLVPQPAVMLSLWPFCWRLAGAM